MTEAFYFYFRGVIEVLKQFPGIRDTGELKVAGFWEYIPDAGFTWSISGMKK